MLAVHVHAAQRAAGAMLVYACATGAMAQDGRGMTQVYQQRASDGSIVLTDRPSKDAVTQRVWQLPPEDTAAALQRREAARLEALAISDRVERQLEAQRQRDHDTEMERMRIAAADMRMATEPSDMDYDYGYAVGPAYGWYGNGRFGLRRPPFQHPRPHIPRPGPPKPRVFSGGMGMNAPRP
jgi:hypothetical protein